MPHAPLIRIGLALVAFTYDRTLFNIPSEELDSIREEARKLLRAEKPANGFLSLPTPPGHVQHVDDGARDLSNARVRKTVRIKQLTAERGLFSGPLCLKPPALREQRLE